MAHLGDIGHQIIGNPARVLSNPAAGMGANGVKVPQQGHGPVGVCMGQAGENLLGHVFGPAVGVGAAAGAAGLLQGHLVVGGVHRSRGGEDDILHPHLLHDLGEDQGGVQVVVIVFPGLFHTLAHGLQAGEVDDAFYVVFRENLPQQVRVPDIAYIGL